MTQPSPNQHTLPPTYDPGQVEGRIYDQWLAAGAFRAEPHPQREPFTIVIPPPNVTGSLHIGHALDNTIQDILVRRRRMQGYVALWLPGTDHAGIATQYVVERRLAEEGLSMREMGREAFLERAWQWKEQYEATILGQLRRLGASCDWSRTRFTLDEGCSAAVRHVFVHLYNKGLVYRDNYMVNWCPRCRTTLADLEVQHEEVDGHLYHIRYPVEGGGWITVATTRPETMLGDTAVAVHPEDERYGALVGRSVTLPVVNRVIPIVGDEFVDPQFGTGAVKITPAHDPDDYQVAMRHNLPLVEVMDDTAHMRGDVGPYEGMDRYACREALVADLQEQGFLVAVEPYGHSVGRCYRCDTVVEPRVSEQWFVRMPPLAEPALAAVEEGQTRLVPDRFVKVYRHWLENIRDWPISRQLWWGHRIPAWYCPQGHVTVAVDTPPACSACGSGDLRQDEDVLDTWFSSALWPFSTLGWPEKTDDLDYFYPTTVLVTGYDILFFWVARMMMMGIEFMGEPPFGTVLLHGLVRDGEGRKMSKSRGNTVDPLAVIDQFGADALRWALTVGTAPGNDVRLSQDKIEGARNFANKLWNASRFVLLQLERYGQGAAPDPLGGAPRPDDLGPADRWILTRLQETIGDVDRLLEKYELSEASHKLHEFIWGEFCDWYIELVKPSLQAGGQGARAAVWTLVTVLDGCLRLLHPIMPFITEEIWQRLPNRTGLLALAPWPEVREDLTFAGEAQVVELARSVIRVLRGLRADLNVEPGKAVAVVLAAGGPTREGLEGVSPLIAHMANAGDIVFQPGDADPPHPAVAAVVGPVSVYVPAAGVFDVDKEIARLQKELAAAEERSARLAARLADERFTGRAPAQVVAKERERLAENESRQARLRELLQQLT